MNTQKRNFEYQSHLIERKILSQGLVNNKSIFNPLLTTY